MITFFYAIKMLFSIAFIAYVPGFLVTFLFFPRCHKTGKETVDADRALDSIERSILAILLSLIMSSATVYFLVKLEKMTLYYFLGTLILFSVVSGLFAVVRIHFLKKLENIY